MGGIITDNLGRSSGLIKGAAAPAGIVLLEAGYCTSSANGGYSTWASRGTSGAGGSYMAYGGPLTSSSESITWGSNPAIIFPSTGTYHIWGSFRCGSSGGIVSVDDGSYSASDGFMYLRAMANPGGQYRSMSFNCGFTVDDVSNDRLRFYTNTESFATGQGEGCSIIVAKFE